jgi:hypothetical protein
VRTKEEHGRFSRPVVALIQCPAPTTSPAWRPARCLVFQVRVCAPCQLILRRVGKCARMLAGLDVAVKQFAGRVRALVWRQQAATLADLLDKQPHIRQHFPRGAFGGLCISSSMSVNRTTRCVMLTAPSWAKL